MSILQLLTVPARDRDTESDQKLADLMMDYEAPLYRFIFAMLRNRDAAEECTQETFVRAYEQLRRDKPVRQGWLYTVARNLAMNEFRRKHRERHGDNLLEAVPGPTVEVTAEIWQALGQLSPDDRALLYLIGLEGRSAGDVGALLGIRTGTVYMRIARARERLRVALGEQDDTP